MATKLKKMRLTSVDLVRAGANPKADICLYKSADAMQTHDKDVQDRKDENRMIKIDKSLFSAEELEMYNTLIAKASVDPEAGEEEMEKEKPIPMPSRRRRPEQRFFREDEEFDFDPEDEESMDSEDEMDKSCKTRKSTENDGRLEEMFKSAFVRQEERIAELEKSLAMKEFTDIAKKYAPLGENEEELAKTLYDMFQADEGLYKSYIDSLEKNLELVNKSGLFAEIGKSGGNGGAATTVGKIESIAKSYMNKEANMSYEDALAKAWENNPDLLAAYDQEYNA